MSPARGAGSPSVGGFEAAEVEFGGDVTLEYHSFELAPDLPADYVNSEADFLQFLYAGQDNGRAGGAADMGGRGQ